MDVASLSKKLTEFLKKYRFAVLVLIIGVFLMLLPGKEAKVEEEITETIPEIPTQWSTSEQLSDILSKIDGAGNVEVMLTVGVGEEILYQTDTDTSQNGESISTQIKTVHITSADKDESGLIRQINPPRYLGAIVVCQGADSPQVQFAIVDAVMKITGLGSDRISVLKMK